MKILFATDGSAIALSALKSLIERFDWFRGPIELMLVTVHPSLPYRRAASWAGKDSIAKYYEEESDAALKPSIEADATRYRLSNRDARRRRRPDDLCDGA